jgi:hypothetical protein
MIAQAVVLPGKMYSYDASVLPNGVYLFQIVTAEGVFTKKFSAAK